MVRQHQNLFRLSNHGPFNAGIGEIFHTGAVGSGKATGGQHRQIGMELSDGLHSQWTGGTAAGGPDFPADENHLQAIGAEQGRRGHKVGNDRQILSEQQLPGQLMDCASGIQKYRRIFRNLLGRQGGNGLFLLHMFPGLAAVGLLRQFVGHLRPAIAPANQALLLQQNQILSDGLGGDAEPAGQLSHLYSSLPEENLSQFLSSLFCRQRASLLCPLGCFLLIGSISRFSPPCKAGVPPSIIHF